jgi:hypothetical protein
MRRFLTFLLTAAALSPSPARAEWQHRVDIVTSFDTFGYRAAKILSPDGEAMFDADLPDKARGEVRGRFRILGSYLHFELEPYTIVPERALMVTLAGIEFRAMVPVWDRLRLGYYHHSSHNFNDGSFGRGIVLDGLSADVLAAKDEFEVDGSKGDYLVRVNGTYFLNQGSSPYLLTDSSSVAVADITTTTWRIDVNAESRHPLFRSEGTARLTGGSDHVPASAQLFAAVTFRFAPSFLGELGEHLYVGPYVMFGANFSRATDFGRIASFAGIRVDLLVSEH